MNWGLCPVCLPEWEVRWTPTWGRAEVAEPWWVRTFGDEEHLQISGSLRPRPRFIAEKKNQIDFGILVVAPGWTRVIGCLSDGQESRGGSVRCPLEVLSVHQSPRGRTRSGARTAARPGGLRAGHCRCCGSPEPGVGMSNLPAGLQPAWQGRF